MFKGVLEVKPGRSRVNHGSKDWSREASRQVAWDKLLPFLKKHAKKMGDYISETFDRVRNFRGNTNLPYLDVLGHRSVSRRRTGTLSRWRQGTWRAPVTILWSSPRCSLMTRTRPILTILSSRTVCYELPPAHISCVTFV